jgi:drug/metabolite transporter (DMT)-like permease
MNLITKLPGPFLIFLGAFSLSFGGLIVKSFEGATLWQILFWRSLFFSLTVLTFLLISYKKKTFKAFKDSGLPGFFGGIILSFGFCGYVFAMYNTTVANTNFIISLQILFLAIFGYFFLKEKISAITLTSIILAMTGVLLMVGNSLTPGELSGKFSSFYNANYFCSINYDSQKISNSRYGSSTICCRYLFLLNWLFTFIKDNDFTT